MGVGIGLADQEIVRQMILPFPGKKLILYPGRCQSASVLHVYSNIKYSCHSLL